MVKAVVTRKETIMCRSACDYTKMLIIEGLVNGAMRHRSHECGVPVRWAWLVGKAEELASYSSSERRLMGFGPEWCLWGLAGGVLIMVIPGGPSSQIAGAQAR